MQTRQYWYMPRAGDLSRLELRNEKMEAAAPGFVRVNVRSIGLNFADIFACLGLYSATPKGGFTPGLEFAGIVEESGSAQKGTRSTSRYKKGDRVMGLIRFGAYSSQINADPEYLYPIPKSWTFDQGAAFMAQALTAYYALFRLANLRKEETVLVQSAAGGVGLIALEMIRLHGCKSISIVGNQAKKDFLLKRERTEVIIRDNQFEQHLGGAKIDVVLDAVMGKFFKPQYKAMSAGGRYVLYGAADLMPTGKSPNYVKLAVQYLSRAKLDPLAMISENKSLLAFNLIWLWDRVSELKSLMTDMMKMKLSPPHVGRKFNFADAPDALRFFQSGQSIGKVVLNPG